MHVNPLLNLFKVVLVMLIGVSGCQYVEQAPVSATSHAPNNVNKERERASAVDSAQIAIFNRVMDYAKENSLSSYGLGEIATQIGLFFRDEPYVAGSLDKTTEEQLVVMLDGFDCVTFVESILALSRTVAEESYSFERFAESLEANRYRNGLPDGYCSRLHYFSEWIYSNEKRGDVVNITQDIGGVMLEKRLNFMTSHRDSYPVLSASDSLYNRLLEIERELEGLALYYVPQKDIRTSYPLLNSGDIVAFATDIAGLDVVHTGFIYRSRGNEVGVLHASTTDGVTVSPDLQRYVENNKRQIGIVIARPNL